MTLLFDPQRPEQVYRGKETVCNRCQTRIFFELRFNDKGEIITKDGLLPNGKDKPDSNLKWFCVDSLSKQDHICVKN